MDLPKTPILDELLLKKSLPKSAVLKQNYSLPTPIVRHLLKTAPAIVYYKLYQSCKLLHKFIEEKYGPQIDVLEAGKLNKTYFFAIQATNKEMKIRGTEKTYNEFQKKLWVRKRLMLTALPTQITHKFLDKLNLSTIKEVYFLHSAVSVDDYKQLMVPSIEVMYGSICGAADEFDIISYTLKELPNLKIFKLPWNRSLTNFAELNSIKRANKLQKAEIYDFPGPLIDEDNLKEFASKHMSNGSTFYLSFLDRFPQNIKNKYQNLADDFNTTFSSKIMIR
uniref:DUF38 domain-containing protein n=1 Tax=Panagrolaimus sp. ES5 TaxID=591445 RepID=A0AC34GDN9_9BILA